MPTSAGWRWSTGRASGSPSRDSLRREGVIPLPRDGSGSKVLLAILFSAVCGFAVTWSITPAPADGTGTVTVTAMLEEGDFVFVREDGRESASFELVASLDEGGFTRAGGAVEMDQLPLEQQLELRGIESGEHRLLVVMRDLESGRRRISEQ